MAKRAIDPPTGRRSYWFRYGDIKHLTLVQLQVAGIGQMAGAGHLGGADVMRVSRLDVSRFTRRDPTNSAGLGEYAIDTSVPIKMSVSVGP